MGAIAKTDIELVEASLRGEHEAFGHLVARYQDIVCAVSYSSTGDQVLSEDVAQETFIAAWRQLERLRNSTRLRPWLCGIARNLARTARKRRRREELVDADEQVASTASPFEVAVHGDVERVVRQALATVPDAYREVLVLFYREDLSAREIANTLDLTEATVMQRLSRGRRHLADSVSALVERSLKKQRRQRDLVASVLASIAVITFPSRVDASPARSKAKGSTTMLKLAIATSAVVAAGTTAYLVYSHHASSGSRTHGATASQVSASEPLHFGGGQLGLAHKPTLGPTSAPRALHSRSVAETDLGMLPADSEAVIGVNFAQMRQSVVWQRYIAPRLADVPVIHQFATACGIDPLTSLGSLSIGLKGMGRDGFDDEDDLSGVIVIHGYDSAKVMGCVNKTDLDAEKVGAKITRDGNIVFLSAPDGQHKVALSIVDPSTALVVIGAAASSRETVEQIAAGNGGLSSSSTFTDALQAINTDDSLWFMLADNSPFLAGINEEAARASLTKLGTTYVSMNITDSLAVDAGTHLGSPAQVAQMISTIQSWLSKPELAFVTHNYLDQLDVMPDGSDLIVSMAMSGEQLGQLITESPTSDDVDVTDAD